MSLTAELFRGHTEAIILAQLLEKDRYGYEINKFICSRTRGEFELNEATLYSTFHRLEEGGLVLSYWGDAPVAARRKYYTITPAGRNFYKSRCQEWRAARALLDQLLTMEEKQ